MLEYLMTLLQTRLANEEGQSMIEYVLLVALIAIVVIAGLTVLGPVIRYTFIYIKTSILNLINFKRVFLSFFALETERIEFRIKRGGAYARKN